MLEVKNKNGEPVMRLTEDNKVHILSEELYVEGVMRESSKKENDTDKKEDEKEG